MADYVVHMSERDAASDFQSLLAKVRAGAEVVIDSANGGAPIAVVRAPVPRGRPISQCIDMMSPSSGALMDDEFASDVQKAIDSHREPLNPPPWD